MDRDGRRHQLSEKWRKRESFTDDEMKEAFDLHVGMNSPPPAEGDPNYPRFYLLWTKCLRFPKSKMTADEIREAMSVHHINVPFPKRTPEEEERDDRSAPLGYKRMRAEPWTPEECEEAIACGMVTREEVDDYHALLKTLKERGYEPFLRGGIDCEEVLLSNLPRTPDDGYVLPCLLTDITYRGKHMGFVDPAAPSGRQSAQWVGRHRETGQLVARTEMPKDIAIARPSWRDKMRRLFGLPTRADVPAIFRAVDGGHVPDKAGTFARFDTPDYECVWLR